MHKLHHYHIYDVINTSLPWAGRVWRGRVISTCPGRPSLCSAVPLFGLTLMTSLAPRPRPRACGRGGEASRLADSIVEVDLSFPYYSHPTTLLLKILGANAWAVPHLKFFGGDRPPSPPRSPPLTNTYICICIYCTLSLYRNTRVCFT